MKFLVVESIDKLRNFSVCQKVLAKHEHQLDSTTEYNCYFFILFVYIFSSWFSIIGFITSFNKIFARIYRIQTPPRDIKGRTGATFIDGEHHESSSWNRGIERLKDKWHRDEIKA